MDDQQRRDEGMAQRRKVLGDAWVDKSIANRNSFNADFIDLITRHAWGEIWTRSQGVANVKSAPLGINHLSPQWSGAAALPVVRSAPSRQFRAS